MSFKSLYIALQSFIYRYPSTLFWILIYFVLTRNYPDDFILNMPLGRHEWAQSDRLSIALAYYHNGFNLFDLATLNQASQGGKVGVELPLIAYLSAIIAKLTRIEFIFPVFRLLTFLVGTLGIFALYKLIYYYTKSLTLSIAGSFFTLISVNYMFYACNYLSDTTAVGFCFMAFYFFVKYIDNRKVGDLAFYIAFISLSILTKMSLISYALSMSIVLFGAMLPKKKGLLISLSIPFLLYVVQYTYIQYRSISFSSNIFLSQAIPFQSLEQVQNILHDFKWYMVEHYMPISQLALWFSLWAIFFASRQNNNTTSTFYNSYHLFSRLSGLMLFFILIIFYLFGPQFNVHDYYFISIFSPFFGISFACLLIFTYQRLLSNEVKRIFSIGLIVFSLVSYSYVEVKFFSFIRNMDAHAMLYKWRERPTMYYGLSIADKFDINPTDRLLVINDGTPNLILSHFNRKGYEVVWKTDENFIPQIDEFLSTKKVDFIILLKEDYLKYKKELDTKFQYLHSEQNFVLLRVR